MNFPKILFSVFDLIVEGLETLIDISKTTDIKKLSGIKNLIPHSSDNLKRLFIFSLLISHRNASGKTCPKSLPFELNHLVWPYWPCQYRMNETHSCNHYANSQKSIQIFKDSIFMSEKYGPLRINNETYTILDKNQDTQATHYPCMGVPNLPGQYCHSRTLVITSEYFCSPGYLIFSPYDPPFGCIRQNITNHHPSINELTLSVSMGYSPSTLRIRLDEEVLGCGKQLVGIIVDSYGEGKSIILMMMDAQHKLFFHRHELAWCQKTYSHKFIQCNRENATTTQYFNQNTKGLYLFLKYDQEFTMDDIINIGYLNPISNITSNIGGDMNPISNITSNIGDMNPIGNITSNIGDMNPIGNITSIDDIRNISNNIIYYSSDNTTNRIIIGLSVPSCIILLILVCCIAKRKQKNTAEPLLEMETLDDTAEPLLEMDTLDDTDNNPFSKSSNSYGAINDNTDNNPFSKSSNSYGVINYSDHEDIVKTNILQETLECCYDLLSKMQKSIFNATKIDKPSIQSCLTEIYSLQDCTQHSSNTTATLLENISIDSHAQYKKTTLVLLKNLQEKLNKQQSPNTLTQNMQNLFNLNKIRNSFHLKNCLVKSCNRYQSIDNLLLIVSYIYKIPSNLQNNSKTFFPSSDQDANDRLLKILEYGMHSPSIQECLVKALLLLYCRHEILYICRLVIPEHDTKLILYAYLCLYEPLDVTILETLKNNPNQQFFSNQSYNKEYSPQNLEILNKFVRLLNDYLFECYMHYEKNENSNNAKDKSVYIHLLFQVLYPMLEKSSKPPTTINDVSTVSSSENISNQTYQMI
ncbi:MAG: hypothetical protein P857_155 [Candidatus Xenolissoclinum pacificiensis L6]|uniref:Uncharacterized protein n=1 Tax=Candidatus Xenolissoclinum pacificiensis L6 TaxID=1401685 RepID=W2UYX8_9RICK|nr:MAG: hypothetical protein P857_155 [Candidatus Xenolissoclinum pacificiensis L6]